MQMIMTQLNPQQKDLANNFLNSNENEKAQYIADFCNKNNISKEQLEGLINNLK